MAEDKIPDQQFYAVVVYDRETQSWIVQDWSEATGREEGNIWDNDEEGWNYAQFYEEGDGTDPEEVIIENEFYAVLCDLVAKGKKPLGTIQKNEEPDVML